MEVAAARVAASEGVKGGLVRVADVPRERAAPDEDASGEIGAELRQVARDRVEAIAILAQPSSRDTAQETDGVRVPGVGQDLLGRSLLDQSPGVENPDLLAHPPDHAQVVADEEDAGAELEPKGRDDVEDLGFDGRVEARRRLVEDEKRRVGRQRHRNHDPLLHPAGQLVRVAAHDAFRVGDLNLLEHRARTLDRLVLLGTEEPEDLSDLRADANGRVQRRRRVLVDHRDGSGAEPADISFAHRQEVLAVGANRAGEHSTVPRQGAHDRERRRRLAAA